MISEDEQLARKNRASVRFDDQRSSLRPRSQALPSNLTISLEDSPGKDPIKDSLNEADLTPRARRPKFSFWLTASNVFTYPFGSHSGWLALNPL